MGGALTAIGSYIFIPTYLRIVNCPVISWVLSKRIKKILVSNAKIDEKLQEGAAFNFIKSQLPENASLSTLRNVAMSSIDSSDKETTVRFMFLSLLSQGIATSILIITITQVLILLPNYVNFWKGIGCSSGLLVIALGAALPFVLRELSLIHI